MGILCKMFGHKPPIYGSTDSYLDLRGYKYSKKFYAKVMGRCARCGKVFTIAKTPVIIED